MTNHTGRMFVFTLWICYAMTVGLAVCYLDLVSVPTTPCFCDGSSRSEHSHKGGCILFGITTAASNIGPSRLK